MTPEEHLQMYGLHLFKSLIKDGCTWDGDVMAKKWSECLCIPNDDVMKKVNETLSPYKEDIHYKLDLLTFGGIGNILIPSTDERYKYG